MKTFKPTYLYIKQHSVSGKLYFGKFCISTRYKTVESYPGSGTHWTTHIKKHGKTFIETLWYCIFYDKEECTNFATDFSELQNIVESSEWLNLRIENGTDGGNDKGMIFSDLHKKNLSIASKGKPKSEAHKLNMGNPKSEAHKASLRKPKSNTKNMRNAKIKNTFYLTNPHGETFVSHFIKELTETHKLNSGILYKMVNKGKIEESISPRLASDARIRTNGWQLISIPINIQNK